MTYMTNQGGITTKIQFQKYSGPVKDEEKAFLNKMIMDATFESLPAAEVEQESPAEFKTIAYTENGQEIRLTVPKDMEEVPLLTERVTMDKKYENKDWGFSFGMIEFWDQLAEENKLAMGMDRNNCNADGNDLIDMGITGQAMLGDIQATNIEQEVMDIHGMKYLMLKCDAPYDLPDGTAVDFHYLTFYIIHHGTMYNYFFGGLQNPENRMDTILQIMGSVIYPE